MAETKVERQKAKSKGFAELGVPVGAVLTFRKDPEITCTVVDDKNKVEYNGKVYPISGLAKELMKTPISGYHAFKYKGNLLAKLGDRKFNPIAEADTSAKPAETAHVAPPTPISPTPQTVPLPRPQEAATKPQEANPITISEEAEHNIDPLAGQPPEDDSETS